MANNNYRMSVQVGMSGTVSNPDGFQLTYTDDILSDVVFVAKFPRIPGAGEETVTLRESNSEITVDRVGQTIDVLLPVSVFSGLELAGKPTRRGSFSVASETTPDSRRPIIEGVIVARGSAHAG